MCIPLDIERIAGIIDVCRNVIGRNLFSSEPLYCVKREMLMTSQRDELKCIRLVLHAWEWIANGRICAVLECAITSEAGSKSHPVKEQI